MKQDVVIEFNKVSKRFKKGRKRYLKQALLDIFKQDQEDFWALKNVSFKIRKGESVGIIGANGSGKSTILKMIAGVLTPTKGQVKVRGKVGPLIELGAGFHQELTGRDNIYLNGTILGLTIKGVEEKFKDIVNFAELQDFIDTPVKHYSSGMYMRLGFSIAIHMNPEILLIDEIFAVGDINFQKKCVEKMNQFKKQGKTLIVVSHDTSLIQGICDRTLLINSGRVVLDSQPADAINIYLGKILSSDNKKNRSGNGQAKIIDVWVENSHGSRSTLIDTDKIIINLKVKFFSPIEQPIFGIIIKDKNFLPLFNSNTRLLGFKTGSFKKGEVKVISWKIDNYFNTGNYTVTSAIAYADAIRFLDWIDSSCWFSIKKPYNTESCLNFRHTIKFKL